MRMRTRLALLAMTAGAAMAVPMGAAHAVCIVCDDEGCPRVESPCREVGIIIPIDICEVVCEIIETGGGS